MDNNLSEKKTLGRRKIQMKKIEKKSSLQVSFSKRRTSLFKKASEISVLCGAKIAILVQSPAQKFFTFGNPSVDSVLSRFETGAVNNVHSEMENNFWWDREVERMELYELEEYFEELEGLRGNIFKRIEEIEKQKLMPDAAAAWCISSSSTNHDYQESEFTYLPDLMLQEQDCDGGAGNVEALVPNVNSSLSASSSYFMVTPAEDHDHLSPDSYVQDPSFFEGIDHHLEVWNL